MDFMNPDQLIAEIEKNTSTFREKFEHLTPAQLNWKPNAKDWSIGQVIDHLINSSSEYFGIVERVKNNTYNRPFIANLKFMVNLFGNTIYKSMKPESVKKVRTFSVFEPTKSEVASDILSQFCAQQEDLKKIVDESREMIAQKQIVSSPINRHIVYYLLTAYNIVVVHQQRHFIQAERVYKACLEQEKS